MALLWRKSTGDCRPFGADRCFAQLGCRGNGSPIEQNSLPQVFGWSWGDEAIMERTFQSANGRHWKVMGTGSGTG